MKRRIFSLGFFVGFILNLLTTIIWAIGPHPLVAIPYGLVAIISFGLLVNTVLFWKE